MEKVQYEVFPLHVAGTEALSEASAEELRVLLCLVEKNGSCDLQTLAKAADVKPARALAAITFWEAAGILRSMSKRNDNVVEEFDYRLQENVIDEMPAKEVAAVIRDEDLSDMFHECAEMLGKPTLNDTEIRSLTALYTQYGVSEEYIITLLQDMLTRSKTSVRALVNKAIQLCGKDIHTTEALCDYIAQSASSGEWERQIRKVLGIYSRALSATEKDLFRKWSQVYGFNEDILALAYDNTVKHTNGYSASYMDKILTSWFDGGCHTVEECHTFDIANKPAVKTTGGKGKEKEKERYGNFDTQDAIQRALRRSYGEEK